MTTRVSILPQNLKEDIGSIITTDLKNRIGEFNSKEKGSVVEIISVEGYHDSVPASGIVSLQVTFKARAFLPKKGTEIDCTIEKILPVGIVCEFCNVKIWIHSDSLGGYKWQENTFYKDDKPMLIGSKIRTRIVTIRYEKRIFSCIGCMVES